MKLWVSSGLHKVQLLCTPEFRVGQGVLAESQAQLTACVQLVSLLPGEGRSYVAFQSSLQLIPSAESLNEVCCG